MKVPKSLFVDPQRNTLYGSFAVAISFFAFAYSSIFGQKAILLYYAVWLPLVLVDYRFTLYRLTRSPAVLAFSLFACLSFFWSAAPDVTARSSVQLFSHILCAVIAARVVDVRTLSLGAMAGVTLVLLYSVVSPTYVYDPLDGAYTFVGAFKSKNQLGFYASLGAFFAFYYALFMTRSGLARLAAALPFCFSVALLFMSQSATSILATPAAMAAVLVVAGLEAFHPRHRRIFLSIGLLLAVVSVAVALNLGVVDVILGAFGKNSTLTGRTYLWSEGFKAAQESPVFGQGYQAFWVQGFSEAERLWSEFYIGSRTGFHFHNTYIETLVGLGYVGTALILLMFLSTIYICIRKLVNDSYWSEPLLLTGILALLAVRSFFEVDVLFPYAIGSFLLYYCWARAREPSQQRATLPPQRRRTAPQTGLVFVGQHL